MPRPGTPVIPVGWSQYHRPVAELSMTARCTIDADGTGEPVWNNDTGTWDAPARVVLHTGVPCRIQQQRQPQEANASGQSVTTHDYLVPVPAEILNVEVGHELRIDSCPDDPSLVGRRLVVTDVLRGSLAWERDLICVDRLPAAGE
ncbi:DUF6093 family protein [Kribbella deserti]|uniref:DUF6093 family protein n=1 Tax=Kribbella deserti TaxID=1926257 RepID=A0ABV6QF15_9ACTN